jgi:hypothetical protein
MKTLLFAIFSLILLSAPAAAQPASPTAEDTDAARAHYERGQKLVAAKQYRQAQAEFSAGYELTKKTAFLFNMAECARLTGDSRRARTLYDRYLKEDPFGALAEKAKQRLAALPPARKENPPKKLPATAPRPVDLRVPQNPAPAPPQNRVALASPKAHSSSRPIWKKWPFWAGVGAAVVLGSVVVYSVQSDGGPSCGRDCSEVKF